MYRVRTVFEGFQGTPWLSTLFFDENGGTAQQAANAAGAFWGAADALMDNEVNWRTEPDVAEIDAITGQLESVSSTTPVIGSGALTTLMLPVATQALVRWRTGIIVGDRELRGRTFVPGLGTASNDNGVLLAASQTTLQTAAAALIADANSVLVIWHRPTSPGASDGQAASVLTANVWGQFATMRSRRD
jgi:hypothetical protein